MMDENDKIIGDSGKLPRNEPSSERDEKGEKEEGFSLPPIKDDEEAHQEYVPPPPIIEQSKASRMTLKEQYDALRDRDTTYVFLFGPPGAGKTGVTSTLTFHMGTDEEGELRVREEANLNGKALLQDIFKRVRTGAFLNRNSVGNVYEIDLVYTPIRKRRGMNFTFLEMSGEDLKDIEIEPNATKPAEFLPQIDVYLAAPKLDILFFLVVDHENAGKYDGLLVTFLDYIGQRRESHKVPKVLLLISKWDAYTGRFKKKSDIAGFVKQHMPMTYGRLNAINGVIDFYTVGEVQKDEIVSFGPVRAAAVKRWMYHAITGQRLSNDVSWWERFLAFLGL